ncbi:hypothetical protein ADIWIN_0946 [Winogradskyella psychrotolerans RS-3]|uniref:DUF5929 domain-containing protein n=1 Tax=Winogradskyella psychrotolerans RS-3 TaxID=641526 RepID=S7VV64_9FLAO|nr:hypothetical protein ADIWIN_0946 [Winogradskyella psychrotolerans RS-3]
MSQSESKDLKNIAASYLICYLNGFDLALQKLEDIKPYLKSYNLELYYSYKETMRILRKVKYS